MKYTRYPMHDAVKKYFPLPNEFFSLNLCSGEIAVYAYLMYCEDRKTFQCHPSYKTICQTLKMSRNTVSKYVKSLETKHLITTELTENAVFKPFFADLVFDSICGLLGAC